MKKEKNDGEIMNVGKTLDTKEKKNTDGQK